MHAAHMSIWSTMYCNIGLLLRVFGLTMYGVYMRLALILAKL